MRAGRDLASGFKGRQMRTVAGLSCWSIHGCFTVSSKLFFHSEFQSYHVKNELSDGAGDQDPCSECFTHLV